MIFLALAPALKFFKLAMLLNDGVSSDMAGPASMLFNYVSKMTDSTLTKDEEKIRRIKADEAPTCCLSKSV